MLNFEEKNNMRPYILKETNWKAIQTANYQLAVLPWGACEAHNFHLPYGTDIIEADYIAAEAARKAWEKGARVVVLPTVPFGVNTGQHDVLLDINMNPSTQLALLRDVVTVLNRQGISKLLILNSHGGNDFKTMIRELGLQFPEMFLCQANWFQAVDQKQFFENKDDYAGEMETSVLLHLQPDWVRPLADSGPGTARKFVFSAMREGWAWAERQWTRVTQDTGVGDPRLATAEKGKRYLEEVTDRVAHLMEQLASTRQKDFYV